MTTKDREALDRILWSGSYMVRGVGYEKRVDNEALPIKRLRCKSGTKCFANKHNQNMCPVEKVQRFGKKGILCRCHICGAIEVFPVRAFEESKKVSMHFDFSAEARERLLMEKNGYDKEDIDAKCELMKEEFEKKDRADKIKEKNFRAAIHAGAEEYRRNEEAKNFKARLDAGEIKFDKTARAFYEVATGRVVRKL